MLPAVAFIAFAFVATAGDDSAGQIEALCKARFAADATAQQNCRARQHEAAAELIATIEMASKGTREYKSASACIERARVAAPGQIDWPRALRCFENRMAGGTGEGGEG